MSRRRSRVVLVSMPFGALDRPALGITLLKAQLERQGIRCDLRYLTFPFAEFLGHDDYRWLTYDLPHTAFAGEWCFTAAVYGERPDSDQRYLQRILRDSWCLADADIARLRRARSLVGPFLDYCLETVPWGNYRIIGFTSTFEQNLASLALAGRIKARWPGAVIVFGGANWEAEMGVELHRRFPAVDYVCSGEAEESFPALVESIMSGRPPVGGDDGIPGVAHRDAAGATVSAPAAPPIANLDDLPVPDFIDYFDALHACTVGAQVTPNLLIETSRGCWWGAKSHCTFCGLNGGTMAFRSKSAGRVLDELAMLSRRWQLPLVEAVDNILDFAYFRTVLPALAEANLGIELFYEVKANLTRIQVALLRRAGVTRIQPGIESLSDHILQLMLKGTTGLRNLQLLKWCLEYGIQPEWNLLYGFPGERADDYAAVQAMLPAISFLPPPGACGPVRLDRFSPYFVTPDAFGLTHVRAAAAYQYLYPFGEGSLGRIAYYFDFDYAAETAPGAAPQDVTAIADDWRRLHSEQPGVPWAEYLTDDTMVLHDERPGSAHPVLQLNGLEQAAYEYCDELRSAAGVTRALHRAAPGTAFDEAHVSGFLESLVANRLMVSDGRHYLALAIGTRPPLAVDEPVATV